jgi:hypothetical protein
MSSTFQGNIAMSFKSRWIPMAGKDALMLASIESRNSLAAW